MSTKSSSQERLLQVICIGKSAFMGSIITRHLLPTVFLTHWFMPNEQPGRNIRGILLTPGCPVDAILIGGAMTLAERDAIRSDVNRSSTPQDSTSGKPGAPETVKGVPWLIQDMARSERDGALPFAGMMEDVVKREDYAKVHCERILVKLRELEKGGLLDTDEVHLY